MSADEGFTEGLWSIRRRDPGETAASDFQFEIFHRNEVRIGVCGLSCSGSHLSAYLSYEVDPEYRRQGCATYAISRVAAFARESGKWKRLKALVSADNRASRSLLEKNGFRLWTLQPDLAFDGILLYCRELELEK
ncbi:MAG: GNAT family N-acetyltransferase [Bryobacteraceae bacterium]